MTRIEQKRYWLNVARTLNDSTAASRLENEIRDLEASA